MNSDQHIRTAFYRDLDQLLAQMLRMVGLVEAVSYTHLTLPTILLV